MARKWKPKNGKLTPQQARQRQRESAHTHAARQEVHGGLHDQGWGTSPGALGEVKRASEEARLATCSECGYSGGRHARMCSQHDVR